MKIKKMFESEMAEGDEFANSIKNGKIYLENHLITEDFIESIFETLNIRQDFGLNAIIIDASVNYIKIEIYTYCIDNTYVFKYDPQSKILSVLNEQLKFTKVDKIVVAALQSIVNVFGEDFFAPNYLETQKTAFLQQNKISDEYSKYYDLSITNKGVSVVQNVKNICTNLDDFYTKNFNLSGDVREPFSVMSSSKNQETRTHGVGFCLEVFKDKGEDSLVKVNFIPFYGKYKKETTELATSFKVVTDVYDLANGFLNVTDDDKVTLLKGIDVVREIRNRYNKTALEKFKINYLALYEFITEYKDSYPFFIKSSVKKSLIRKNIMPLHFSDVQAELYFTLKEQKDFFKLTPRIRIEKTCQINSSSLKITPFFCLKNKSVVHFFNNPRAYIYLLSYNMQSEINIPIQEKDKVLENVILPLSEFFKVEHKLFNLKKLPKQTIQKKEVYVSDFEGKFVVFKLGVRYNDQLALVHTNEPLFDKDTKTITHRNEDFESEFIEYFKELHPAFQDQEGIFYLEPTQLIENEWLLKTSQKLKQHDIEIFGAKDLKSFKYSLYQAVVSFGVKSDIDWFDLDIEVKFGKEKVAIKDIRKAVLNKNKYITLKDGSLGILPEKWLNKFSKYFRAGEVKDKSLKISNYQFNIIDDLYEDLQTTPDFLLELQKKKQNLQNLKNIEAVKLPKTVKANLRPYQQEGLNWLVFLNENQLGGCLADDMGLGKTLQTIALLAYLKKKEKNKKPSLIVAPTSLVFNWQKEFEKFTPTLNTLIYTGIDRKQYLDKFNLYDVVLTTYGSVLNDIENLKDKPFYYVILDESQAIKNPNSKRYKSVRLLKSDNRLALTGTPIENNTFDLYAQMNFINPGLFGAMSHFKKEFSDSIDKTQNQEASDLLHEIIYPFLLRRTKKQVATDLPEKTESIVYCEMGKEQRKVYDAFKNKYREYLLNKFEENGESKSQMYVLEGLTKLRQICNSPQLLNEEEEYSNASIKLDTLLDNVKTVTSEGSKVLVFSQFTSMLALIQERLETENIVYEYLDGKTRDRETRVKNFQENDCVKVFLISLKAGGTGLNLTKAEYVFLVDPWWNPAVENQAVDRCYRIGQTKKVMAYRMICKDTIEEKIISLQENKKAVSESIIQIDKVSKSFDKDRVKDLFS